MQSPHSFFFPHFSLPPFPSLLYKYKKKKAVLSALDLRKKKLMSQTTENLFNFVLFFPLRFSIIFIVSFFPFSFFFPPNFFPFYIFHFGAPFFDPSFFLSFFLSFFFLISWKKKKPFWRADLVIRHIVARRAAVVARSVVAEGRRAEAGHVPAAAARRRRRRALDGHPARGRLQGRAAGQGVAAQRAAARL